MNDNSTPIPNENTEKFNERLGRQKVRNCVLKAPFVAEPTFDVVRDGLGSS